MPKFKRSTALEILRALDVSGDEDEAFAGIGAFRVFADGRSAVKPVEVGELDWQIWVYRDGEEIVIGTRRKNRPKERRKWSQFVRDEYEASLDEWSEPTGYHEDCTQGKHRNPLSAGYHNQLSLEELCDAAIHHPEVGARLRGDSK